MYIFQIHVYFPVSHGSYNLDFKCLSLGTKLIISLSVFASKVDNLHYFVAQFNAVHAQESLPRLGWERTGDPFLRWWCGTHLLKPLDPSQKLISLFRPDHTCIPRNCFAWH